VKELIKVKRSEMIEQLVQSDIEHFEMYPEGLEAFLLKGFAGYQNYTDDELVKEYREYVSEDEEADIEISFIQEVTQ
jgi:hypothetical protein